MLNLKNLLQFTDSGNPFYLLLAGSALFFKISQNFPRLTFRDVYLFQKKKMEFLGKLLITAVAVLVSTYLLPGVEIDNILAAILVAAVLSFLNAIVKPVLIILSLPITVLTLGLFLLVINAVIIQIADWLIDDLKVHGFWYALLFSLVLSLVNSVFNALNGGEKRD
jgi:putative membrane protein